jgi:hypothetical protein
MAWRRDVERGRQLASKTLRRFESSDVGRRAEAWNAPALAFVGDARRERGLRPDDDEVGTGIRRERGLDRDVVAVAAACPGQSGLAATRPDHENPHDSTPSKASLAWASATSIG